MAIAPIIRAQADRAIGKFPGKRLGFNPTRRTLAFIATQKRGAGALLRRANNAGGAPHVTFDMVTEPLERQLREMGRRASPQLLSATIRAIALKILRLVHLKTPVDSGLARSTWSLSMGIVKEEGGRNPRGANFQKAGLRIRNPPTPAFPSEAERRIKVRTKLWPESSKQFEVSVENFLEYIIPLEFGWSGQAPLGMVRLSIAEVSGLGPKALAVMFQAHWLQRMKETGRELRAFSRKGVRRVGKKTIRFTKFKGVVA